MQAWDSSQPAEWAEARPSIRNPRCLQAAPFDAGCCGFSFRHSRLLKSIMSNRSLAIWALITDLVSVCLVVLSLSVACACVLI